VNDTEALQRTVRRVGAVLLVALARIGYEVTEFGGLWAILLGGGAVLYLLASLFVGFVGSVDAIEEPAEQRTGD
jgi:hypothetical protein